ncbi:HPr family phosphocarrier protein [Neisseriaceae bacterium PsAf]|nr:HPr family phosphocarrier protein [Neisseriaceae bacterium PsAf]MCV2503717.1 HPr family phosphocarrier protein [Neisseriaceae bacterium]
MIKQYIKIINKLGLHARASSLFVQTASRFQSDINVTFKGNTINGKSILGLMMLAANQGSIITLEINGPDEDEALSTLVELIQDYFGEGE